MPVNLAGRPAKVGGSIAKVLGWLTLALGLAAAAVVGALLQVIFPAGVAGWIVGGVIATLALALGVILLISARKLHVAGTGTERDAAVAAISALAARQGGAVSAEDVGRALRLPVDRADALLTALAKEQGERFRLEVDDAGRLLYFVDTPGVRVRVAPRGSARFDVDAPPASQDEELDDAANAARRRLSR
jgi:hypothetical protein